MRKRKRGRIRRSSKDDGKLGIGLGMKSFLALIGKVEILKV
jgi:hypothetical protein